MAFCILCLILTSFRDERSDSPADLWSETPACSSIMHAGWQGGPYLPLCHPKSLKQAQTPKGEIKLRVRVVALHHGGGVACPRQEN